MMYSARLFWGGIEGAMMLCDSVSGMEVVMHRHELTDEEWAVIAPFLPTDSPGVERLDDRRVKNCILWHFRTGSC